LKALVKTSPGFGNIEIRDVDEPVVGPDETLIKVKAAGICGSDVKHYKGVTNIQTPIVLGHEFSGEIVEVGPRVKHLVEGERVVSETSYSTCGVCVHCLSGDYHLCAHREGLGSKHDGVFTELVAVPERIVHKIPDEMSYEDAALVQPCADICNAVIRKADISPGDHVAVLGPGPMGLLTTQVAKASGAGSVTQTGHRGVRLSIASRVGADNVVAVEEEDAVQKVMDYTGGVGADVVFEASGSADALAQALDIAKQKGQVILIASPRDPVNVDFRRILGKPLTLKGSIMSKWVDYETAIRLMSSGVVKAGPIVTHRLPLEEWEKAFNLIRVEKTAGKILLIPK
jgi:L-iditol 2-dehydrogenase